MSTKATSAHTIQSAKSAERSTGLPIIHELTLAYKLSLIVAIFMAVASLVGLLNQRVVYPTDELRLSFLPSDMFNGMAGLCFVPSLSLCVAQHQIQSVNRLA